ncbi:MAG TPA: OmpA family protein [Bryobacteraceae bacterium]|nr:OmpA family protein [Bryobacteraceae bacterium]
MTKRKITLLALGFCFLLFASACKKKVASVPPPPPLPTTKETAPPPPRPAIAMFAATPSSIQRGQSSTLRWSVKNATNVKIEPSIGVVQPGGSRQVFPQNTSTYTLTAKGAGGTAEDATSVTVTVPTPTVAAAPAKRSLGELVSSQTRDAYFDFDKYNLRPDARTAMAQDATALKDIFKDFTGAKVMVEGHCDERGSAEYNLALGDRRAKEAKDYLVEFGVPAAQLATISYGKERPQCTENDEACWQRNRRAHLSPGQ